MDDLSPETHSDSLAHQAYRVLEQAIVTLALAPGSLVTEKQLIDLAGQGRTPVREAILKLEWQRLIVVKPRSGLRIADIAPSDWQNVMAVRRRLEPEAAALVARHADDGQRRRLVECARDMSTAAVMADTVGFLAADKRFDDIMEHACPNRFLSAALAPLRAHARRLWCATATTELMDRAVGLHLAVIRAIQTGDCVEAAAATGRLLDALPDLER